MFGGSTAPTGYLMCDGSAVSRTTYADLFKAIGTTYGTGDGSTTFNVPNLKGKVPVGRDSGDTSFDTLGETGGAKTVTLTSAQSGLPSHTHDVEYAENGKYPVLNGGGSHYNLTWGTSGNSSPELRAKSNTAQNASQAHNNLQPYIVLNYIIKT